MDPVLLWGGGDADVVAKRTFCHLHLGLVHLAVLIHALETLLLVKL